MNCYTYSIGWSALGIWYYGAKYSKKSDPMKLWNGYFTSSEYVKQFREEFGEPDLVKVRKTFGKDADKCVKWERRFLKRVKAASSQKFLNMNNGNFANGRGDTSGLSLAKNPVTNEIIGLVPTNDPRWSKREIVGAMTGAKHTQETKAIISKANKGKFVSTATRKKMGDWQLGENNAQFGNTKTPETREKLRRAMTGKVRTETFKKNRMGGLNGRATPVTIDGITYSCKKEAREVLNISIRKLNTLLKKYDSIV